MIRTLKAIKKNSFHGDNVRDSHTVAAGVRKKHSLLPDRIKPDRIKYEGRQGNEKISQ